MKKLLRLGLVALCALTSSASVSAVEKGHSYEQVVREKGAPLGRMERERNLVLTYADQRIRLVDGKVVAVEARNTPVVSAVMVSIAQPGEWINDYTAGVALAREEGRRVFLLFTESDAGAASRKLDKEVLLTKEFNELAQERLALVWLDFSADPTRSVQLQLQNEKLAAAFGVSSFPTVVVLDGVGKKLAQFGYEDVGAREMMKRLRAL